jgi:hypothetical protein
LIVIVTAHTGDTSMRAWVYRGLAGLLLAIAALTAVTGCRIPGLLVQDLPGRTDRVRRPVAGGQRCLGARGLAEVSRYAIDDVDQTAVREESRPNPSKKGLVALPDELSTHEDGMRGHRRWVSLEREVRLLAAREFEVPRMRGGWCPGWST